MSTTRIPKEENKPTGWGSFFSFPQCHVKLRIIGDKHHAVTIESPCDELENRLKDPLPSASLLELEPTADLEITEKNSWFFKESSKIVYSEQNLPARNACEILRAISKRY